jgi:SWI/SNF-related matrix-associated actin-dependent regulator 1 of chromatin subfamily A
MMIQVLGDLPKKFERIEWCEMTTLQKKLYNDALRRSRKTVMDLAEEPSDSAENKPGKKAPKKGKANARKEKQYVENSANVLMDLRKAASHPMLFRSLFTDQTVSSIAKVLLKEPDFKSRGAVLQYVREDLEVMTDSELQVYMASYKVCRSVIECPSVLPPDVGSQSTQKFLQDPECYFRAGKIKILLKLLKGYMAENRRLLIFSQARLLVSLSTSYSDIQFAVHSSAGYPSGNPKTQENQVSAVDRLHRGRCSPVIG